MREELEDVILVARLLGYDITKGETIIWFDRDERAIAIRKVENGRYSGKYQLYKNGVINDFCAMEELKDKLIDLL